MKTRLLIFTTTCLLSFIGCSKEFDQKSETSKHLKSAAVIDGGTTYQSIDGFGFSDGWSGTLSSAKSDALYTTIGMSIFRAFINPNSGDYVTPAANITAAHNAGAVVFATAWADRSWGSSGHLPSSRYADYANWIKTEAANKNVDYVSPFNEPDGNVSTQIRWTPTEILNFIKNNASTIGKPIIMPEAINFNDSYSDPVLNDATASSKISVVAGHFYGGGNVVHQNALDKGKHVWETEHFIENSQTDITACMTLAKEISDAMNNKFSAYCWWWVNEGATDGSNLVNSSGTIYKNGYIMGQFAKWIRPGKTRIAATYNPTSGVYVTAYRNNGIVVVAVNTSSSSVIQSFSIQNISGLTSFNVHRTSGSENMASKGTVTVSNNAFLYTLPAQSVTTFHQY
ncbi:MAG: glucuronoxylanase XynC [Bacteroidota bacterium]|nr:glucuronoxylanase XynC [Bacteroidota bacterium]